MKIHKSKLHSILRQKLHVVQANLKEINCNNKIKSTDSLWVCFGMTLIVIKLKDNMKMREKEGNRILNSMKHDLFPGSRVERADSSMANYSHHPHRRLIRRHHGY